MYLEIHARWGTSASRPFDRLRTGDRTCVPLQTEAHVRMNDTYLIQLKGLLDQTLPQLASSDSLSFKVFLELSVAISTATYLSRAGTSASLFGFRR